MKASSWASATAATKSKASNSTPNPSSPNPASSSCKIFCLSDFTVKCCSAISVVSVLICFLSPIQIGENRAINFHPAPELSEPQIFIGAVLMVVVIHDWNSDPLQPELVEDIHRHAATC